MKAIELRRKYIEFFKKYNHKEIPSASLIPENDPTVLFTTAGMHPLVPFLLGTSHPLGKRLTNYQKCLRTDDIDEVGDAGHLTFFEMMGNWSLGDYFKDESIKMSYEFLTKELGIDIRKISVTVFEGDNDAPRDETSAKIWESLGIPKERIYYFNKKANWWGPAGQTGPCGPDTEIFFDTGKPKCSENCDPSCDCGKYLEIWNNVFMEYNKTEDGNYEPLKQKNVDTGLGLERATMVLQGKETVFDTELFAPIIQKCKDLARENYNIQSGRIIADHTRASLMLLLDGVRPSNVEQGYILRRLIRRVTRHLRKMNINLEDIGIIANTTIDCSKEMYPDLEKNRDELIKLLIQEKDKFIITLENGEKEFNKYLKHADSENTKVISGDKVFKLYDTFGFPPEMTEELAQEQGYTIDMDTFNKLYKEHQEKSREGATQKFKGGIADHSEKTTAYHTATHLLHKALQIVLGEHATQCGSNITEERLRFDFKHPQKVTPEELQRVEDIVNEQIKRDLVVTCEEMSLAEAKANGATGLFENKYGDFVKVYTIGDFSKEICGGPHLDRTGDMGTFKIKKEEASSAGVRRIKALLVKEE
ncbi:MAG: alanine--tRNA ligase [Clostridia bacterium]|nr:alanine--tRNA ligase [Clostridia bacterium]